MPKTIIVSDMDGTLLDEATYSNSTDKTQADKISHAFHA